jgi:phage FluMu protein Com
MGLCRCKNKCDRDSFFLDRKAKKFGYNNNTVYGYLRKYCSNCDVYLEFKSQEEYNKYIHCPCCGNRFRTRPAYKGHRESFHKRINHVKVYY